MNKDIEKSNEITIDRIKSAVAAGVKIKTISNSTGITYFRIASVVNVKSYRYSTAFSMEEIKSIHKALDQIKDAL